jgi:hypothetical protein
LHHDQLSTIDALLRGGEAMNSPTTEWVVLPHNIVVIACETGEVWFLELEDCGDLNPFSKAMTGKGSHGSTAGLLSGAIALGFGEEEVHLSDGAVSLAKYVYNLVGTYHNARRTPGNYILAAKRLRKLDRPEIASYLETHALEETGHDRLIIKDLRALGLPAERIVTNLIPEGVKPLVRLFDLLSSSDYPIGCIGYSYCFEYTAAMKPKSQVDAIQALCPEGIDASRFLRTHSSLGSEVGHVEDLIDLIAGLPASDRIEIVKAAYETAATTARLRRDVRKADSTILTQLQAAAEEEIRLGA